jgi:hypothetical protein
MRTRVLSCLLVAFAFLFTAQRSEAQVNHLVISQVYGGGGNSGAPYTHDFVELFNPTTSSITFSNWSIQYASATGTSWTPNTISGTIPAGGYFLIRLASTAAVGVALPAPDATGSINMSGTAGKVALVSNTTALTGACPTGATIIDFVGYGTTANCFEGSSFAPAPSNTTAAIRKSGGCTDTDVNSADFSTGTPTPRNSASAVNICTSNTAPVVTTVTATSITVNSAVSGGNVTADGGLSVTARGVVWSTGSTPTVPSANTTSDGTGTGSFASTITALVANTKYFYRAYATNSIGTGYGITQSFTTLPNAPVMGTATNVLTTGFTANWSAGTGGTEAFTYTLEVDDDINFGSINSTISSISSAASSAAVSGLASSTTYYYRVKAVNATGSSAYSSVSSAVQTTAPATPSLSVIASPADFGAVCINQNAVTGSFTISANDLNGSNVLVGAVPGFTYSTSVNGTYSNTLDLTYTGGGFTNQVVYIKFTPTTVQSYNGTIAISGGGLSSAVLINITGSGVNTPATVSTGTATVNFSSVTLGGTISATGCGSITAYGIEYSTTNGFADGSGTQVAGSNLSGSNFTVFLNLNAGTTYYYKAYATNAAGTAYGAQGSFSTSSIVPVPMASQNLLRYTEAFDNITGWANNFTAGSGANRFGAVATSTTGSIPSATRITTSSASFSSGTSGGVQKGSGNIQLLSTGATDNSSSVAVDFYMDFTGVNAGTVSFDWASVNNSTGDRKGSLRVYASTDGSSFTELTSANVLNFTNNVPSTGTVNSVALPASFNNNPNARLRFYYHNGSGGTTGSRPKISIDNLVVTAVANTPCATPLAPATALVFNTISETTVSGSFTAPSPAPNEYLVIMSSNSSLTSLPIDGQTYFVGDNVGDGTVIDKGSDLFFTATGLTGSSTYYFFVISVNSVCTGGPKYLTTNILTDDVTTAAGLPVCAAPTAEPTALQLNAGINNISGSFTGAGADQYLVLISTSSALTQLPVNGTAYSTGAALGNATVLQSGAATTFNATGLTPATTYYIYVFGLNATGCLNGPAYNTTALSGTAATQPLPVCATPVAQPYSLSFNTSYNSIAGTFNGAGAGYNYLVVQSTSANLGAVPADGTDYAAGNTLGTGTVIANTTATSFIAGNLSGATTYYYFIFAADKNCTGGTKYLVSSPLTGSATTTSTPAYNYYFGTLHSHSDYSDGNKDRPGYTPADDWNYALGSQGMDFLGISEHNHFSSLDNPGNLIANYKLGLAQADAFNATHSNFLALYGMEWGVISGGGHVVVYGDGLNDLFGWESNVNGTTGPNYDVYVPKSTYLGAEGLFAVINTYSNVNAFATLAHPSSSDYNNLSNIAYDASADAAIVGTAVESGPANSTNTSYSNPASPMFYLWYYQKMLSKGYHLGPTIDHDNHNTTFGRTTAARTAVLAPALTRTEIVKAFRDMRFYATEDVDAKVDFTVNTRVMGSVFEDRNAPTIAVNLTDPTTSTSNALIRVMFGVPGSNNLPVVVDSVFGSSLTYVDNALPNNSTGYYYVDITNGSTRIVTSPIWYTRICSSSTDLNVAACGSYSWNGNLYTSSTVVTRTFTTTSGCDSTVTLHLTINQPPSSATITTPAGTQGCPGTGVALNASANDGGNGAISSYIWSLDGNTVATTTTPVYTALTSGVYTVQAVNTSNCSVSSSPVTISVTDNTAPVLVSVPANANVSCNAVPAAAAVAATDDCDQNPAVTLAESSTKSNDINSTGYYNYTITRSWTARDASGNTASASQIITVLDQTAPVLQSISNISVSNDAGICGAVVNFSASASDDCSPVTVSYSTTPGSVFPVGTTVVTVTATDVSGNSSSTQFSVTVNDTEAPVITAPGSASSPSDPGQCAKTYASIGTPVVSDNCGIAGITNDHPSMTFPVGTTLVTWTVTDINGNQSTAVQSITVIDNEMPVVTVSDIIVDADPGQCGAVVLLSQPSATDNCGIASISNDHPSTFYPVGTTAVTWTVFDLAGYKKKVIQHITVKDATAPVVVTKNATLSLNVSGTATLTVTDVDNGSADNCGIVSYALSKTSFSCADIGTQTVTLTATDASGNSSSASAEVTVVDVTVPAVVTKNAIITLNASGTATLTVGDVNNGSSDNCGIVSYNLSKTSFSCADLGPQTVTLTATDASGNTSSATAQVTVEDATAPVVVTKNAILTLNASGTATLAVADVNDGSSDNCGIVSYNLSKTSFSCADIGIQTVTLTATDASGNSNSLQAQVTVVNNGVPLVQSVPDQSFCVSSTNIYTLSSNFSAGTICGPVPVSYAITGATSRSGTGGNASGIFNAGVSTITWTYSINGTPYTATTKVTVVAVAPAGIVVSTPDAFCNKLTLSASSTPADAGYTWKLGTATVGNDPQLNLGLNNTDGLYQLFITNGTCTSTPASYTYNKQTLISSYTLLGLEEIELGENNTVASGSVGVVNLKGAVEFKKNSAVTGAGAFVKAAKIVKDGSNIVIANPVFAAATGISLPTMYYNTVSTNGLSSRVVQSNASGVINGNYKNLTIQKGANVTISGNLFGNIRIEQGAQVTFSAPVINIEKLQVVKGPRYGYTYLRFSGNTRVQVSGSVNIASQTYVNPDNNKVTFYMGDNKKDDEKFTIKGGDTRFTANIYMPNGQLRVAGGYRYGDYGNGRGDSDEDDDNDRFAGQGSSSVYMTGQFIIQKIEGDGKNVVWNSFDCGSNAVPVITYAPAINSASAKETVSNVSSDEDLKVTVMPNPSRTHFTLKLESRYTTPVNLRVMDNRGRVVDARSALGANSTVQIGHAYADGVYYAELVQDGRRKTVQLIKQR